VDDVLARSQVDHVEKGRVQARLAVGEPALRVDHDQDVGVEGRRPLLAARTHAGHLDDRPGRRAQSEVTPARAR